MFENRAVNLVTSLGTRGEDSKENSMDIRSLRMQIEYYLTCRRLLCFNLFSYYTLL